jgi:hypothetical protein
LLPIPKGAPALKTLQAKGLVAGADDGKWVASLDATMAALVKMQVAIGSVDPTKPSSADVIALQAAQKNVEVAVKQLGGLQPSTLAVFEHRDKIEALVGKQLAATAKAHQSLLSKGLHSAQNKPPPPPPCPNCFTLVGTMVSIGVQYALASIPTYTGLLKDMGWVIGEMAVTLLLKDIVDDQFPAQADGPSITAVSGLSVVAVTPGMPLNVLANNFGTQPGECGVVFVTPAVSKAIVDGVKLIMGGVPSFKDLKSKGSWQAAKVIKSAIDQLKGFVTLGAVTIPSIAENGVVLMSSQPGSSFASEMAMIKLGTVPKKANCGSAIIQVPKPGFFIPYCRSTGRGPSYNVTVIGKKC